MDDLSIEEVEELVSLCVMLVETHAWKLLRQKFLAKAADLNKAIMNDPEHRPFDKGRFAGINDVINKPYELIEQFNQANEDGDT